MVHGGGTHLYPSLLLRGKFGGPSPNHWQFLLPGVALPHNHLQFRPAVPRRDRAAVGAVGGNPEFSYTESRVGPCLQATHLAQLPEEGTCLPSPLLAGPGDSPCGVDGTLGPAQRPLLSPLF